MIRVRDKNIPELACRLMSMKHGIHENDGGATGIGFDPTQTVGISLKTLNHRLERCDEADDDER